MLTQRRQYLLMIVSGLFIQGQALAGDHAPRIEHYDNAQAREIAPFNDTHDNVFFEDILASDDPEAPIACAFFRMEKGKPLTYTYTYDEAKIMLDGEMTIDDGQNEVHANAGDVIFLPEGVTVTFTSQSSGTAFTCGQREGDSA